MTSARPNNGFTILFYILMPVLLMLAVLSHSIYIVYVAIPLSLVIGCLCFFLKTRNAVKFIGEDTPPLPGYYESNQNVTNQIQSNQNQNQTNQNQSNQNQTSPELEPIASRRTETLLNQRIPEPFLRITEISPRPAPPSYNEVMSLEQDFKDEPPSYTESCIIREMN